MITKPIACKPTNILPFFVVNIDFVMFNCSSLEPICLNLFTYGEYTFTPMPFVPKIIFFVLSTYIDSKYINDLSYCPKFLTYSDLLKLFLSIIISPSNVPT